MGAVMARPTTPRPRAAGKRWSTALPVALAALVVGGVWWASSRLFVDEPAAERAGPDAASAERASSALRADGDPAQERAPAAALPFTERRDAAEPGAVAPLLEGRVLLPPGTPADERPVVVAQLVGAAEPERRAAVEADGTFVVALSSGARRAVLELEARYLFLERPVRVPLDGGAARATLEPRLGGRIVGRVIPPPGEASPGPCTILARAREIGFGSRSTQLEVETTVDADTLEFALDALPARYAWRTTCSSERFVGGGRRDLAIQPGATTVTDFELRPGVLLAGIVHDEGGQPVRGALVAANSRALAEGDRVEGKTDVDGRFALPALTPGQVRLFAERGGLRPAVWDGGELREGDAVLDLDLLLETGQSVAGRVTWPDGRPAAGAVIALQEPLPEAEGSRHVGGSSRGPRAAEDGTFELAGLGQGPYVVSASLRERPHGSAEPAGRRPERAAGGSGRFGTRWRARAEGVAAGTRDLVLVLDDGLTVQGSVRDDLGRPLERFAVRAARIEENRVEVELQGEVHDSFERPDGTFELAGLEEGTWRVVAWARGHGDSQPAIVRVPSEARGVALVVPRAAGLAGRVVDPLGRPVPRAEVVLDLPSADVLLGRTVHARSDELGGFHFETVRPGPVLLSARADGWAPSAQESLELEAGEARADVELALAPSGRIEGRVRRHDGRPAGHVRVWVRSLARGASLSLHTDASGRFAFRDLPPGGYDVSATPDEDDLRAAGVAQWAPEHDRHARVELEAGQTVQVELGGPERPPLDLRGSVSSGGQPVPGAAVSVRPALGFVRGTIEVRTDAAGRFALALPAPGEWVFDVSARRSRVALVRTIPDASSYEVHLELPSGRVAGRVLGPDGEGVARVVVRAEAESGPVLARARALTDPRGRYVLSDLAPGSWTLTTDAERAVLPGTGLLSSATLRGLLVGPGASLVDVDLELHVAGELRGRVLTLDGEPVADASIELRDAGGAVVRGAGASSDESGRFVVTGVPAGDLTVIAHRWREVTSRPVPVRVIAGGVAEVELELAPGTELRITALDAGGHEVSARLKVEDEDGRDHATPGAGRWKPRPGSATRRVGPLPPGRYRVTAILPGGARLQQSVALNGERARQLVLRER